MSICSLATVSETWRSSWTVSLSRRTRSLGTARFSTTGSSAWSVTSCSSSEMAGPSVALSTLASVIGSRSTRTSSRCTGTVVCTSSVTTYLRSRARPVSCDRLPTSSSSSERVMASCGRGPRGVVAGGAAAAGLGAAIVDLVVLVERPLLRVRQLAVGIDARRVLDVRLGVRHAHAVAPRARLRQRHERALAAEQPGLHERPLRLLGARVDVDLVDGADLVAVGVQEILALPLGDGLGIWHGLPFSYLVDLAVVAGARLAADHGGEQGSEH